MASGDTKTEAMLNVLGNGGSGDEFRGCCNTKTQQYILDAIDRINNIQPGGSYEAGAGIEIADNTISVDTDTIQPKLTAGTNITIDADNVISASGGSITPVQTTGSSTTDVMSQDATTSMIYGNSTSLNNIRIGSQSAATDPTAVALGSKSNAQSSYSLAIGSGGSLSTLKGPVASGTQSMAFGLNASATQRSAISFGGAATTQGVMNVAPQGSNNGYNSSDYRLITGVYDGQTAHDAATKGQLDSIAIKNAGAPTTATVGTVGQLLEDTTNGKLYICTAVDNTDPNAPVYTWTEVGAGGSITPVQTTGTSTTDVMSQNAVTSMVFTDPSTRRQIQIGSGSDSRGGGSIAIGLNATPANNSGSIAIGAGASASATYATAIGYEAKATRVGEVNIGSGTRPYGYNNTLYRVLGGVHDPVDAHDAATKGYVDGLVGNVASALNAINNGTGA